MRITVTGAGGFIGSFLVEALTQRGDNVEAWTRRTVDVTDAGCVVEALERFAPEVVVHLAAQSLPGRSWDDPAETYRVNVGGTIALLEAARTRSSPPRVLLAGSSAEYGEPADGTAIAEDARIAPNSPYGSSKFAVTQLGELYRQHYGLDIVGFRPFALVGPRKTGDVCSDFARRIVAIERGADPRMLVGDVSVVRDMIDVRDGVDGLLRLIDDGVSGEMYNICAGRGVAIGDILRTLSRMATVPVEITQDRALLRPLEQKVKIGDPSKLRALGWSPVRPLDETLADILAYWRAPER
jgi:GDP-4-dehydro-6-deoxy-D-mannose reductase